MNRRIKKKKFNIAFNNLKLISVKPQLWKISYLYGLNKENFARKEKTSAFIIKYSILKLMTNHENQRTIA